ENQIHNILEGYVARVRPGPTAPAYVVADTIGRQALNGVIEDVDLGREPAPVVGKACGRHHAVEGDGATRIIELQQEPTVDDHLVFGAHRLRDRGLQLFVALVVLVLAVRDYACR